MQRYSLSRRMNAQIEALNNIYNRKIIPFKNYIRTAISYSVLETDIAQAQEAAAASREYNNSKK